MMINEMEKILEECGFSIEKNRMPVQLASGLVRRVDFEIYSGKEKFLLDLVKTRSIKNFVTAPFFREITFLKAVKMQEKYSDHNLIIMIQTAQYTKDDQKTLENYFQNYAPGIDFVVVLSGEVAYSTRRSNVGARNFTTESNFSQKNRKKKELNFTDIDLYLIKKILYTTPEFYHPSLGLETPPPNTYQFFKQIHDISRGKCYSFVKTMKERGILETEGTLKVKSIDKLIEFLSFEYSISANISIGKFNFTEVPKNINDFLGKIPADYRRDMTLTGEKEIEILSKKKIDKSPSPVKFYYLGADVGGLLEIMSAEEVETASADFEIYLPRLNKSIQQISLKSGNIKITDPLQSFLDSDEQTIERIVFKDFCRDARNIYFNK